MNCVAKYNVVFMGSKQAGMIGLLTLAVRENIIAVVANDDIVANVASKLDMKTFRTIHDKAVVGYLQNCDLLVSVHGRQIVPDYLLKIPKIGAINVHPCLYKYKGIRPVPRMLEDNETRASVGIHWMTEKLDEGEVVVENFQDVVGRSSEVVYNELYPLYVKTILEAVDKIKGG